MDRGFQKTPPFENSANKGNFKRWETLVTEKVYAPVVDETVVDAMAEFEEKLK